MIEKVSMADIAAEVVFPLTCCGIPALCCCSCVFGELTPGNKGGPMARIRFSARKGRPVSSRHDCR